MLPSQGSVISFLLFSIIIDYVFYQGEQILGGLCLRTTGHCGREGEIFPIKSGEFKKDQRSWTVVPQVGLQVLSWENQRCGLELHDLDSSQTRFTNMMTCNSTLTLTPMTRDLTNDQWLNLDLSLLTQTDLIPSPSPNIKHYAIKKTVQRINSSFNR